MKILVPTIVLSVLFLGGITEASAHEYKTDGSMTVLLHTDPSDSPVAGEPSTLHFGVVDTSKKFSPIHCDCTVTVTEGGTRIVSKPLTLLAATSSLYTYSFPFVFPKPAVYQIILSGHPTVSNAFQTFQVEYNVRVERGANPPVSPFAYLGMGVLTLIICVGIWFLYNWSITVRL